MVMHCADCMVEYRDGFAVCADCGEPLREGEPPSAMEHDPDELVEVFESRDSSMIAIAGSILREAGIRFVERTASSRGSLAGVFGYNPAAGPRRLFVAVDDADDARELLAETEEANAGTAPAIADGEDLDEEIVEIEKQGWNALASSPEDARDFYRQVLHEECVMLFPGGLVLQTPDEILDSFAAGAWDEFDLSDTRTVWLGPDAMALIYRVQARRGDTSYEALVSSTYLMTDGEWKLILHQQTPVR